MLKIKIINELMHGPIWAYNDEDIVTTVPEWILNDETVSTLNIRITELYDSYFEFDSHDEACWFNEELANSTKGEMDSLIESLVSRLKEINNNRFILEL